MGVPLAEIDRVAIGRRAREPANPDAAARAANVLDITGWPSNGRIRSAKTRAVTSVEPPGGNGTIMVIWRAG